MRRMCGSRYHAAGAGIPLSPTLAKSSHVHVQPQPAYLMGLIEVGAALGDFFERDGKSGHAGPSHDQLPMRSAELAFGHTILGTATQWSARLAAFVAY